MRYDKSALTPFELAMAEEEDGRINHLALGCTCALEESEKWFGVRLPTAAEFHQLHALPADIKSSHRGAILPSAKFEPLSLSHPNSL